MALLCPGYMKKKRLGEGGFGVVYLARRQTDQQLFAVKAITHTEQLINHTTLNDEVHALQQLKHPNIVIYEEVIRLPRCSYLVMEYCRGGDLRDILNAAIDSQSPMAEGKIQTIFVQLVLALHHCHHSYFGGWSLLHRDIKPENVLFTSEGRVKLADFGLCRFLGGDERQAVSMVGTPGYFAPEILSCKPYDAKADMYSLGCLLYEMCTLSLFSEDFANTSATDSAIEAIKTTKSCAELKAILLDLLALNPKQRPSTADLLSRRSVGLWLQNVMEPGNSEDMIERERRLLVREAAIRSRERVVEAKAASIEVQFRRLAYQASTTPSPGRNVKENTRSPSPRAINPKGRKKAV